MISMTLLIIVAYYFRLVKAEPVFANRLTLYQYPPKADPVQGTAQISEA